ncbi:MAG: hypothetical protein Q9224_007136, partial [Gallowayella concinna]
MEPIPIDANADLTLVIGVDEEAKKFRVSSKAMSLASPVWRAMLSPKSGFKEASLDHEDIPFPEDSPQAVFIVFLICHMRFQDVPETLEFEQLVDVCAVCDKYDCVSLLRPWLSKWVEPWKKSVTRSGFEEWAYIAWVIGEYALFHFSIPFAIVGVDFHMRLVYISVQGRDLPPPHLTRSENADSNRTDSADAFRDATDQIVSTCTIKESRQCWSASGELLDDALPHGIAGSILQARKEAVADMIRVCHAWVKRFKISSGPPLCKAKPQSEECDTLVCGSLMRGLQSLSIWPGNLNHITGTLASESVQDLSTKIKALGCHVYPTPREYTPYGHVIEARQECKHDRCSFAIDLHDEINCVVKGKASDIMYSYRTHLETQRKKLGASETPL